MTRDEFLRESFLASLEWLVEVDSTNTYVIDNVTQLTDRHPLPLLVGANRQLAGRGRGRNLWWANDGALTFSILINPQHLRIAKSQWPLLSLTVGLSVCAAVRELQPHAAVQLKWPNDVYVDGKKICGVLNETIPAHPDLMILGIGVNMNNSLSEAPIEIQATATSLTDLTGETYNPWIVLKWIATQLEQHCELLAEHSPQLAKQWRSACYLSGRMVTLSDGQTEHTGTCLGIDDDGALRIQTPSGEQRFFGGVISQIL